MVDPFDSGRQAELSNPSAKSDGGERPDQAQLVLPADDSRPGTHPAGRAPRSSRATGRGSPSHRSRRRSGTRHLGPERRPTRRRPARIHGLSLLDQPRLIDLVLGEPDPSQTLRPEVSVDHPHRRVAEHRRERALGPQPARTESTTADGADTGVGWMADVSCSIAPSRTQSVESLQEPRIRA